MLTKWQLQESPDIREKIAAMLNDKIQKTRLEKLNNKMYCQHENKTLTGNISESESIAMVMGTINI